jgi:hypothetical protein
MASASTGLRPQRLGLNAEGSLESVRDRTASGHVSELFFEPDHDHS